jgi:hypothetical protein
VQQIHQVATVLLIQRQIQSQLMTDAGHESVAGAVAGDQSGRVARDQVGN